MKEKQPVSKNEKYNIKITDLGYEGEGIGRVNGFTVFVPGLIVGEEAEIVIVKVKKSFAYGKALNIIAPSEDRNTPECRYYKTCGGCSLMHMKYDAELKFKQKRIKDCLERIGGLEDIETPAINGMEEPYFYRNKGQFPLSYDERNGLKIGFYAPRSHRITDLDECLIQHKATKDIIAVFRRFIAEYGISIYDENTHKGLMRTILTKTAVNTDDIMVCAVINGKNLPNSDKLVDMLRKIPGMRSILININTKNTNVVLGGETKLLWGDDYIIEKIGDISYKISALSFFQVNTKQTEVICRKILDFGNFSKDDTVLDLYCGIGTLSLWAAKKAGRVFGVEIVPQAIEDAKENARMNGIENAEFMVSSAEDASPMLLEKGFRPAVVMVDPPRKGCDETVLNAIVKMNPNRIVYVSCNPSTLARDLKKLGEEGYKLEKIEGVDQFGRTGHVECVVLLYKNKQNKY